METQTKINQLIGDKNAKCYLSIRPCGCVVGVYPINPDEADNNTLEGHSDRGTALTYSPSGRNLFSVSCDNTMIAWNVLTGEQLAIADEHCDLVNTVVCAPDGKHVITGAADKLVGVWRLEDAGLI